LLIYSPDLLIDLANIKKKTNPLSGNQKKNSFPDDLHGGILRFDTPITPAGWLTILFPVYVSLPQSAWPGHDVVF
jgi:hypothetical protein